jgi:trimeric autotransporter adhesin
MFFNSTGSWNTAVGDQALDLNFSGISNCALGGASLMFNSVGSYNTAVGNGALLKSTKGSNNFARWQYRRE